jgi:predicted DNA-binding transcriptional regulator AlpA
MAQKPHTATDIKPVRLTPKGQARFISKAEVMDRVGLSFVQIWEMMREGKFPAARDLGCNRPGWIEAEIDSWIKNRPLKKYKPLEKSEVA